MSAPREALPRRVLVIRRRALGDLVLALPAVAELRRRLPEARIDLLVDRPFVAAARAWSAAHRVLEFPDRDTARGAARAAALVRLAGRLAGERYGLALDLHSTPQTATLARLTGARRRVGFDLRGRAWAYTVRIPRPGSEPGADGRPRYLASALLEMVARALGENAGPGVTACEPRLRGGARQAVRAAGPLRLALSPGASWSAKAWPTAAYRELARRAVADLGARVVVFWGPGEQDLARAVVEGAPGVEVAAPGDAPALAERLRAFDLLISGDSGARHVAMAAGVRTLAIFGPTDPWTATPPGGRNLWLRYPIACAPCQRTVCPLGENYCLSRVSAAAVLHAVRGLASRAGGDRIPPP